MISSLSNRNVLLFALACLVLLAGGIGGTAYFRSSHRGLPYHDAFALGRSDEWTAMGGTWEIHNGAIHNESDERGAKLLSGSSYWRDYSIEADVMLLGGDGDAGLIARSSDEELGVDAYSGYYAGLRSTDNTMVLGRAGHGWIDDLLPLDPETLENNTWYHLKLLVYGCQIVATATFPRGSTRSIDVTDEDCLVSGRAGLRSFTSGGAWRNVVILPATAADLAAAQTTLHSQAALKHQPVEARSHGFASPAVFNDQYTSSVSGNTQSMNSLRLNFSAKPTAATVRGSVILTSPILIVEDSTGGVYVPHPSSATSLKVGDQVELNGEVHATDYSAILTSTTVRGLWTGLPLPPVTLNASQAATGMFDATFIEVEGQLVGKHYGQNDTFILDLEAGSQSFSAIMSRDRARSLYEKLKPDSRLQIRGVCVVDPTYTHSIVPFVLLLPSTDDVKVLAGPPWWNAGHLAALAIGILFLALIANAFVHHIENWRLHAIFEERERLAHEMHDTVAQSFAGIGFQLEAIRSGLPAHLPQTHQQLNLASDLVRHSHQEARRSIAGLRPDPQRGADPLAALEQFALRMVSGGAVQVIAERKGGAVPIHLRVADTLFRIGQEATANAIRHAHPGTLTLSLQYLPGMVELTVADDGVGFDRLTDSGGFGIRGMRKRAESISATFRIQSAFGEGTIVRIAAPLPPRVSITSWTRYFSRYSKRSQV